MSEPSIIGNDWRLVPGALGFAIRLGKQVRTVRKALDMRQHVAATALDISRTMYCNHELGRSQLSAFQIARLAALFGCDANALIPAADDPQQERP